MKSDKLSKALNIASSVHNYYDKGGTSYILHPIRIMMRLRTDDEELMCIAVLHDVVEDSDISISDLREEGFSERILEALELLTHREADSYQEYIEQIALNYDAVLVKMQDLRDNMDASRLKGATEKDIERMGKYMRSYNYLKGIRESFESCIRGC
jgi:guanosine-3',5'-bis(diphosphate) 3'-pyrophosphohydrolase